jgi:hypothetical protein
LRASAELRSGRLLWTIGERLGGFSKDFRFAMAERVSRASEH